MPRIECCLCACLGVVSLLCAGCPAPYPAVPHHELARRILEPPEIAAEFDPHGGGLPEQAWETDPAPIPPGQANAASEGRIHYVSMNGPQGSITRPVEPPLLPGAPSSERLTLSAAIDLAYRASPILQGARAKVCLAEAGKQIAYADFLPQADIGFRSVTGDTHPPGFMLPTMATSIGNVAFGGPAEEFRVAELRVQWTVWDFGRTTSRFGQSLIAEEIAGLQYVRSQQTVAFEVAMAYFEALAAEASVDVAEEAVRRAQSVLDDAKNFLNRGTAIRNDVLRAEVFVKEMQLELVKAQTARGVAIAKLNRAIGINASTATQVVPLRETPGFVETVADCLQLAVENRREFGVVERGIARAKLGENLAESDFLPRIYVGGLGALQNQGEPHRDGQHHLSGGVGIELGLFEGGRRLGQMRSSQAETDLAVARGKEVCDQIAYEVRVAYLAIDDARQRIDMARAAAAQASENLRVVGSTLGQGDAIVTDLIDAQLTLTKAQKGYLIATYDYQAALVRMAYAAGLAPEYFLALPAR